MGMRTAVLIFLLAASLGAGLVAQAPEMDGVSRISQAEFKKLVDAGGVVIVDTRGSAGYEQGHIPGALLLPLEGQADFPPGYDGLLQQLKASKKPIVTYCA